MPPKLINVTRLDSLPLGQTQFTPEGYLRDTPILTSVGIFEYQNPDGSIRRELRLPEDVFDPESLASYKGKPIIISHDAGLIDKDNVDDNSIGTILTEGFKSGYDVRADIVIYSTDKMKDSGFKQLSLGYNLDLDETPGNWHGQHYDAIQKNIRINHLALVKNARAGEQARLNIDGRDYATILVGGISMKKPFGKKARADGMLTPDQLAKAIEEYKENHPEEVQNAPEIAPAAGMDTEAAVEPETKPVEKPAFGPRGPQAQKKEMMEEEMQEDELETAEKEMNKPIAEEEPNPIPAEITENLPDKEDEDFTAEVTEIKGRNPQADKDMARLLEIIDTLMAEKEFDEAALPEEEEKEEDQFAEDGDVVGGIDDMDKLKKDCGTMLKKDAEGEEDEDVVTDLPKDKKLNMDSIDRIVSAKIQLGMIGRKINLDGLETMPITKAKKTIISAVRPNIRLDGRSEQFINTAYQLAVEDINARTVKDTKAQKRQMFNKDSAIEPSVNEDSAEAARERMIKRHTKNN